MSDNPLVDSPDLNERIRQKAYFLWEADGCTYGRDVEYWERAEFLTRMKDSARAAELPNPATQDGPIPGVVVEEAQIQENYGESPTGWPIWAIGGGLP
jgi:hypothetical protein